MNLRTFSDMSSSPIVSRTILMSSWRFFASSVRLLVNILCSRLFPPKGCARKRSRTPIWYQLPDELRHILVPTPYHGHRIADLQDAFKHEVRHQPVNTLQSHQGFRGSIGGNECMEDRGCESRIKNEFSARKHVHETTYVIRPHSITAWYSLGSCLIFGVCFTAANIRVRPSTGAQLIRC